MNVKNNKRRRQSKEKIEGVFIELLQKKRLEEVTVSDICKLTNLNRSTFYANYTDIYHLADCIKQSLEENLRLEYADEWQSRTHSYDFVKLFRHIKENQLFYKTYFKLDYNDNYKSIFYNKESIKEYFGDEYSEYRIEFFKSGITAMIKMWLEGGCKEEPEYLQNILNLEYRGRK